MSLHEKMWDFDSPLLSNQVEDAKELQLHENSRVAVIGGGPAGSFVSYFLLNMASQYDMEIDVDIYEPRSFSELGPKGCNHCGGIISESLIQIMAADGINLPPTIIQRGIDSYVLHMDPGKVRIETPLHEKRIAAVYRGGGPRKSESKKMGMSFDTYLLTLALMKGASHIKERVTALTYNDEYPVIKTRDGSTHVYDLVVGAVGVNSGSSKIFEASGIDYRSPQTTKTYINEIHLGAENVEKYFGSSMHLFLLNIPRLEFAALIPKGEYVTLVMLGREINRQLVQDFLNTNEVKACFPASWIMPEEKCHCSPRINITEAPQPFRDRLVLIGDCGVSRLYKDGIGAAYRTAKAAAMTAVFKGVSADSFRKHYYPAYRKIAYDNKFGKLIFGVTHQVQRTYVARKAIFRMVIREQQEKDTLPRMSSVFWDTFTGNAPYKDIILRTLQPGFVIRLMGNICISLLSFSFFRYKKPSNGRRILWEQPH